MHPNPVLRLAAPRVATTGPRTALLCGLALVAAGLLGSAWARADSANTVTRPSVPAVPATAASAAAGSVPAVFDGVMRIVAIGDIHGDFEKFTAVLSLCQITDAQGRWVAGSTHMVQTGDVLDRGPDSKKVMDRLMELEAQATKAGGRVHALLGNHEYMVSMGDLRYVSDGELAAFGEGPRGTPIPQAPLGTFPKFRAAFSKDGKYGRWLFGHNAIVKINGTLFMHGGLSPRYARRNIVELNDAIRAELRGERDARMGVGADPEGPLWFRGLAESLPPQVLDAYLPQLFAAQSARRIVMGHTIQDQGISLRAGERIALIDVGMSRQTINGAPSCLVIEPAGAPGSDRVTIRR
ncbi:MAG: metallophosphoesterase [Myxococcales bacterium]|nr:metallophosphoesterase [Myxococcales bacterium]